ncbi:hypothetical protein F511_36561 [Dorcoceras hygrometricum]|uniref:Uncharacterized protein n=1 Tax=Dorcoceras hygrometricum TaxID=472368 RepID=A0A2Z7ACY4_9LAMI|nr:hypothetical protein F511_36561 [Dorcoceras hygrometricum]
MILNHTRSVSGALYLMFKNQRPKISKISKSTKIGPISNIGPKTSWAARDKPEQNLEDSSRRNAAGRRSNDGRTAATAAAKRAAQGRAFLPHGSAHIVLHNVRRKAARCCPSAACMVRQRWRTTALICARPAASGRRPARMGVYRIATLLASRRLASTSFTRKPALQTVGGGRSSIWSTTGINLPPSICTRRSDGFCHGRNLLVAVIETSPITRQTDGGGAAMGGGRIQLVVGPQPLRLRNHNFGLTYRIMVKRLATSPHDPLDSIGYPRMKASGESSTTKHRLLHASGPHPIPPPNDPNRIMNLVSSDTTKMSRPEIETHDIVINSRPLASGSYRPATLWKLITPRVLEVS